MGGRRRRQVDLQWRSGLSRAGELTLGLVEQVVFGVDLDGALKAALKNRRDVAAMFASQPLSALIDDIEEALKAAAAAAVAAADDAMTMVVDVDGGGAPGTAATPVVDELPEEVLVEIKSKKDDDQEQLKNYVNVCWRKIDTWCSFIQESADATAMRDALSGTCLHKLRQEPQAKFVPDKKFVVISYDLKVAGEASSHPATRLPPLRQNGDHLKLLLRACIDSLDPNFSGDRDLYFAFDGGRPGPQS